MKNRKWLYSSLFILGFGLPVMAGLFSKGVSKGEGAKAVLRLAPSVDTTASAIVDVARFGVIKDALQPWRMRIYVRIENDTETPRRVRVTLDGCSLPIINWHVRNYTWDKERQALQKPLLPGQKFGIYLFMTIPESLHNESRLCDGMLHAFDDDTGEILAMSRLQIVNSTLGELSPRVSSGHEGGHHHDGALHN